VIALAEILRRHWPAYEAKFGVITAEELVEQRRADRRAAILVSPITKRPASARRRKREVHCDKREFLS
jgi:hypothetical protein